MSPKLSRPHVGQQTNLPLLLLPLLQLLCHSADDQTLLSLPRLLSLVAPCKSEDEKE